MNVNGKPVPDDGPDDPNMGLDKTTADAGHPAEPDVKLDATAQALIGQHLRAIYDEIRQQDVPDHLLRLLDELERKEREA